MSATALFIFLSIMVLGAGTTLGHTAIPLMLSLGFWALLFLFYIVTPIQFISIGLEAFIFMLCCFCLYAAGYYLGINRKLEYHVVAMSSLGDTKANKCFLFFLCVFLTIVYFRIDILRSQIGDISYLISNPYLIRVESVLHGFSRGYFLHILELFILPVSFFVFAFMYKSRIRFKIYALILFTGIIGIQLTTMSRGLIIYSIFLLITLYLIQNRPHSMHLKRIKNVVIVVSVTLVFLFSLNFFRTHEGAVGRYAIRATSFRSWVPQTLINNDIFLGTAEIMRYINCGIYGFAKYTEKGIPPSPYHLGAISFSGGLKLLAPFNVISYKEIFSVKDYELVLNPTFTVVYTFFREQYEDFGLLGTLALHFLWGFTLGLSYRKYLYRPTYRGLIIPSTLTVWYIYGAYVMQTVFTISFVSPFVSYFLLTVAEKRPSKIQCNGSHVYSKKKYRGVDG